jgi:RNA polymerase sigma-70 factor (ECF subfamily)
MPAERADASPTLADAFAADRRFVWGLCYRLTGSTADADDLVQETFARALERPPAARDAPWRPWLVRVALNLGRDLLRRRKRRRYPGPWLPALVETPDDDSPPAHEPAVGPYGTTEGRYELMESVSLAFLLALEALTPRGRAVLLLRDVFDYSVEQTADALDMSAANVKTTLHRARRAMRDYDRARVVPTRALQARTRDTLVRFLRGLAHDDQDDVEALLAEDVRALSDGGGERAAARKPVLGRDRVKRYALGIARRRAAGMPFELRLVNGLPAVLTAVQGGAADETVHVVTTCDVDASGRITRLYTVLATAKLGRVRFPAEWAQASNARSSGSSTR